MNQPRETQVKLVYMHSTYPKNDTFFRLARKFSEVTNNQPGKGNRFRHNDKFFPKLKSKKAVRGSISSRKEPWLSDRVYLNNGMNGMISRRKQELAGVECSSVSNLTRYIYIDPDTFVN